MAVKKTGWTLSTNSICRIGPMCIIQRQMIRARIDAGIPGYSQLYDVLTFPTLYLLDKEKRIVAKKLTLPADRRCVGVESKRSVTKNKKQRNMYKKSLIVVIACFMMLNASAQTLFTYGKYSADAKEFLRAFNKNNVLPVANKAKAISDYLDLYIKSRLKIQEAYERKYDTLPQIKTEVENLRTQIAENYMTDPDMATRLTKEAFQRSLKDIHVAHIFISFRKRIQYDGYGSRTEKKRRCLAAVSKREMTLCWSHSKTPMTLLLKAILATWVISPF
jgi:hypothetical protein